MLLFCKSCKFCHKKIFLDIINIINKIGFHSVNSVNPVKKNFLDIINIINKIGFHSVNSVNPVQKKYFRQN
jgi:hypothetical protein